MDNSDLEQQVYKQDKTATEKTVEIVEQTLLKLKKQKKDYCSDF